MRLTTSQYLEREQIVATIRNANAAVALLNGQPVVWDIATGLTAGLDVKRPAEGIGGSFPGMLAGVVIAAPTAGIAIGDVGNAVVYGFTDVIIVRRTRAATSDSWPTSPAITEFCQLVVNSVNDALTISGTLALGAAAGGIFAAETSASSATLASATASSHSIMSAFSTATAQTTRMKGFVRLM